MLAALLACAPPPSDDTAAATLSQPPCGAWAGVVDVGTRWTYEATDTYVARWGYGGTSTVEVTAIDGDSVTLTAGGDYSGDGGTFTWDRLDTWRCDGDGAWIVRSEASAYGETTSGTIEQDGWRTFDPGWRIRPATPEAWEDSFVVASSAQDDVDATCSTTVEEEGRTFDGQELAAIHVVPTCEGVGADASWLGEGVGLLETEDVVLVAYE